MDERKRIYIEQGWRGHPYYKTFVAHPPAGYQFLLGASSLKHPIDVPGSKNIPEGGVRESLGWNWRWLEGLRGSPFCYHLQHDVLEKGMPLNLVKSYLDLWLRPPPPGIDLIWGIDHLVLHRQPWILRTEHVAWLLSFRVKWLGSARMRRLVERVLASPGCRRIVSFLEAEQNTFLRYLNCEGFGHKFAILPLAIPAKPFRKAPRDDGKVRLLLVGTTQTGMFYVKGVLEALECFRLLRQRFPHLELGVRSEVPAAVKKRYAGLGGLRILDSPISAEALEAEFAAADIFLFPSRVTTPLLSILEGMSYQLPVVACDVFGTRELVRDGETGFLAPLPNHYVGMGALCQETVEGLVERLVLLIEDEGLRERMGRAGRRDVEEGVHSIGYRNKKLREILDEATADLLADSTAK